MYQRLRRQVRITRYHFNRQLSFDLNEHFWAFIGSFLGIGIIAFIQSYSFSDLENVFLIGSFGASSVLIYGAVKSPLAQPRNLVGGHLISALIGVTVYKLVPDPIWISAPLAVSLAIILMQITKTIHPPGGATALIAVIGTAKVKSLGYFYVLSPVLSGVLILLLVALLVNNLGKKRQYPVNGPFTKTRFLFRRRKK